MPATSNCSQGHAGASGGKGVDQTIAYVILMNSQGMKSMVSFFININVTIKLIKSSELQTLKKCEGRKSSLGSETESGV